MQLWYLNLVLIVCFQVTLGQHHGGNADVTPKIIESCSMVNTACIGYPKNCFEGSKPCESMIAVSKKDGKYHFSLFGPVTTDQIKPTMAVGLSQNPNLMNTSIVRCAERRLTVLWMVKADPIDEINDAKYIKEIPGTHPGLQGQRIVCEFIREDVSTEHENKFDLNKDQFYVSLIPGHISEQGHYIMDKNYTTEAKVSLNKEGPSNSGSALFRIDSLFLLAYMIISMIID